MRRLALVAALLLAATWTIPAPAGAAEPQTSLADIEDEVMCTVCGITLELANAPQAQQERELINELVAQGKTKEEIKDALVVEYGPEVLAVPSAEGFDLVAWVLPIVAFIAALIAITLAARRWRGDRDTAVGAAGAPAAVDAVEDARLSADLRRYDP